MPYIYHTHSPHKDVTYLTIVPYQFPETGFQIHPYWAHSTLETNRDREGEGMNVNTQTSIGDIVTIGHTIYLFIPVSSNW